MCPIPPPDGEVSGAARRAAPYRRRAVVVVVAVLGVLVTVTGWSGQPPSPQRQADPPATPTRTILDHRTQPPVSRAGPGPTTKRSGTFVSQGVAASHADAWHAAGVSGQGVAVAIIGAFADWEQAQLEGELPPLAVSTVGDLDLSTPEGTACAEVIYDMAPGAALTLASASGYLELAQLVDDLAAAGHQVIVSSVAPVEPGSGDGTGVLADAIAEARDTYDVVFVQAAGDYALQHWEGSYSDVDADDVHEFEAGSELNRLGAPSFQLVAGQRVIVQLSWDDWPVSDQDFDLYLYRWIGTGWDMVDASDNYQTGTEPPFESIDFEVLSGGSYAVTIERYSADTAPFFNLLVLSPNSSLEFQLRDRSLGNIAASQAAVSVGAVDVSSAVLEETSSWGPTYGPGGTPSGGSDQPRLAAFSAVDTWSFESGGFSGTVAAASHVAGAAALVRAAYPAYGAVEIQSFLEGLAVDGGDPGYDHGYGFGELWLGDPPAGCLYSLAPTSMEFGTAGGDGSFAVTTSDGCDWTVASDETWITVTSAAGGSGPGTVTFQVDANAGADGRTGTITAAAQTFTVIQAGSSGACSYTIAPASASYPDSGGSGSISVNADAGCDWTAVASDGWIVVTAGSAGSGPGTTTYEVQPNLGNGRSGSIVIADQVHTVVQSGSTGCSYSITPESEWFSAGGGNGSVSVATDEGCQWTAESNNPDWLTVTHVGLGVGPGRVDYRVESNPGETRIGSMTIAGLEFTVEQAGRAGEPFRYHVPGVAHLTGAGGSEWRTALCVTNASAATTTLTLTYTTGSSSIIRTFRMDAYSVHEWADVAVDLFGRTQQSAGSVEIISREPIMVTARTYNVTENGTFGQFMPGLDESAVLAEGEIGFLPQIRRSSAFRTNIGLQNRTALPTTVEVMLFDAHGSALGDVVEVTVPPVGWVQVNDVFIEAGAGACELGCATVVVTTPGGKVWAYASVVDNRTGDPTTIPLMIR